LQAADRVARLLIRASRWLRCERPGGRRRFEHPRFGVPAKTPGLLIKNQKAASETHLSVDRSGENSISAVHCSRNQQVASARKSNKVQSRISGAPETVIVTSSTVKLAIAASVAVAAQLFLTEIGQAASDKIPVGTVHAQGAQVYECKATEANALVWQFREPIATLFENGKTIGRHYAGPTWEFADGSLVVAKVSTRAPGATPNDIPVLTLDVTKNSGAGRLAEVTTIERINTRGGVVEGPCPVAGAFLSVPYAADYAFYRAGATTGQQPGSAPGKK
jgi:hypothetical protein